MSERTDSATDSAFLRFVTAWFGTVAHWWRQSETNAALRRLDDWSERVDAGVRNSRTSRPFRAVARYGDTSRVVQWFTRPPDHDELRIDWSETWTVGPAVAAIDALTRRVGPAYRTGAVGRTVGRVGNAAREAPIQAASASVLGLALGRLAASWPGIGRVPLAGTCLAIAVALLGLRVQTSWDDIKGSAVGRSVGRFVTPPGERR